MSCLIYERRFPSFPRLMQFCPSFLSNDSRLNRFTNKFVTNRGPCSTYFRQLSNDKYANFVCRDAAPNNCKIFIWLIHRLQVCTNEGLYFPRVGTWTAIESKALEISIVNRMTRILFCLRDIARFRTYIKLLRMHQHSWVAKSECPHWANLLTASTRSTIINSHDSDRIAMQIRQG